MFQAALLTPSTLNTKSVTSGNIKASFLQWEEGNYEVLLEVNSNKMLIALEMVMDHIQEFEILAIRGFIELTTDFITTIKKLIGHLFYAVEW